MRSLRAPNADLSVHQNPCSRPRVAGVHGLERRVNATSRSSIERVYRGY